MVSLHGSKGEFYEKLHCNRSADLHRGLSGRRCLFWNLRPGDDWLMVNYDTRLDLICFTYQGATYRIKIPGIMNVSDYDYLKFLYYLVNQETHLNVTECLQALDQAADRHYMNMIGEQAVGKELVRFEKHMIWNRYLLFKSQDPNHPGFTRRPEVTNGCRGAYQEIMQKAEEMLLNYYGVVFRNYQSKTGFTGTAYTLARLMAAGDEETERRLNDIREQERRYCS